MSSRAIGAEHSLSDGAVDVRDDHEVGVFRELGLVDLLTKLGDRRIDVPGFVSAYDIRQGDGRLSRTMSTGRGEGCRLQKDSLFLR